MTTSDTLGLRSTELRRAAIGERRAYAHRLMMLVLVAEWAVAIALAEWVAPLAWAGRSTDVPPPMLIALVVGPLLSGVPIYLALRRPHGRLSRHAMAVAQMGWSTVLVHLTGGRIDTHFHIFASLAFLAFYADWTMLVTATLVVALDHVIRGALVPESLFGTVGMAWPRKLEHAAWILLEDAVLVAYCRRAAREMSASAERAAELDVVRSAIEDRIEERTSDLSTSLRRFQQLTEGTRAVPWEIDMATTTVRYLAPQATALFGYSHEWLMAGGLMKVVHPDDEERLVSTCTVHMARAADLEFEVEYRAIRSDHRVISARTLFTTSKAEPTILRGITLDISRETQLELELRQAQKLEAVGRLAAGVAHEINTPIQFVSDSVHFVRDGASVLAPYLSDLRALAHDVVHGGDVSARAAALEAQAGELDVDYVLENLPKAIQTALDGLDRVTTIVRSMKAFAHPEQSEMVPVDLNEAVRTTITIAKHEYKYVADVETDLGDVPEVLGHPGEINQVLLNLIVNAAHAIGDVVGPTGGRGTITVRTRADASGVTLSVTDTGTGIPPEFQSQIFDPFFTTKAVGKGTGQGLAIARSIIIEKHRGTIRYETAAGRGTTFFFTLPYTSTAPAMAVAA